LPGPPTPKPPFLPSGVAKAKPPPPPPEPSPGKSIAGDLGCVFKVVGVGDDIKPIVEHVADVMSRGAGFQLIAELLGLEGGLDGAAVASANKSFSAGRLVIPPDNLKWANHTFRPGSKYVFLLRGDEAAKRTNKLAFHVSINVGTASDAWAKFILR
jgi:hypothetical protein